LFERSDDCLQKLGLGEGKFFTVDKNELFLEKFGGEHNLHGQKSRLVVDGELKRTRDGTMGFTTTNSLGSSPVTYSGHTTTFLRGWFPSGTCSITHGLHSLPDTLALVLKVLEHIMDNVSSKRLIEAILVECDHLV